MLTTNWKAIINNAVPKGTRSASGAHAVLKNRIKEEISTAAIGTEYVAILGGGERETKTGYKAVAGLEKQSLGSWISAMNRELLGKRLKISGTVKVLNAGKDFQIFYVDAGEDLEVLLADREGEDGFTPAQGMTAEGEDGVAVCRLEVVSAD